MSAPGKPLSHPALAHTATASNIHTHQKSAVVIRLELIQATVKFLSNQFLTTCSGLRRSGPGDARLEGADYQTLAAGELLSVSAGKRGVAMIQLTMGWELTATPPAFNPFVLRLLRSMAADKELVALSSAAPQGLGLTALVAARRQPFQAWASHLASFGAQARGNLINDVFFDGDFGAVVGMSVPYIVRWAD